MYLNAVGDNNNVLSTGTMYFCLHVLMIVSFFLVCCSHRVLSPTSGPLSVTTQPSQGSQSSQEQPESSLERPIGQRGSHHTV